MMGATVAFPIGPPAVIVEVSVSTPVFANVASPDIATSVAMLLALTTKICVLVSATSAPTTAANVPSPRRNVVVLLGGVGTNPPVVAVIVAQVNTPDAATVQLPEIVFGSGAALV